MSFLGMSDEDFLKMEAPAVDSQEPTKQTPSAEPEVESADEPESELASDTEVESDAPVDGASKLTDTEPEPTGEVTPEQGKTETVPTVDTPTGKKESDSVDTIPPADKAPVDSVIGSDKAAPPNYEDFYQKMMAPFRANGKTIQLKTPEEALQLMQMGANYTRKMQDLQPHRKILTMLENNGLMDEGQLSFLIDIQKKNPEAIRKLLKDSSIDPMDIDMSTEPAYQEGNHRVTDDEVAFRAVLDDLGSNPEGKETLKEINTRWDQASKEVLWSNPELMTTINQQRESGIYQRIVDGIERERTLGKIGQKVSFLEAYQLVGNQLQQSNGFADIVNKPAVSAAPVAVREAVSKPAVANSAKVAAATLSRTSPRKSSVAVNPLSMDDDAFLKQMKSRL